MFEQMTSAPKERVMGHIDYRMLNEVSGGDMAFERELLDAYATSIPAILNQLMTAADEADWKEAVLKAHSLKGSSRSIGAVKLADLCQKLEDAVHLENLTEARSIMAALREESTSLLAEVAMRI
jgi:HPt (histidine-containing phosphotransfer) domain-containing protein